MKALSLWQPYATLIAVGAKMIETRSWAPPKSLVGQDIAIHASKSPGRKQLFYDADIEDALHERMGPSWLWDLPFGCVVAIAKLESAAYVLSTGLVAPDGTRFDDGQVRAFCADIGYSGYTRWCLVDPYGDFTPGRCLWFLEDIRELTLPRPARGRQGLWEWDEHES